MGRGDAIFDQQIVHSKDTETSELQKRAEIVTIVASQ